MMAYERSQSTMDNFGKFIHQFQPENKILIRKIERIVIKSYRQHVFNIYSNIHKWKTAAQQHTHTHTHSLTYIYIYIYIKKLIHSNAYTHTHTQRHICIYVDTNIKPDLGTHKHTCTYIYIFTEIHARLCSPTNSHPYMPTQRYTKIFTHVYINNCHVMAHGDEEVGMILPSPPLN